MTLSLIVSDCNDHVCRIPAESFIDPIKSIEMNSVPSVIISQVADTMSSILKAIHRYIHYTTIWNAMQYSDDYKSPFDQQFLRYLTFGYKRVTCLKSSLINYTRDHTQSLYAQRTKNIYIYTILGTSMGWTPFVQRDLSAAAVVEKRPWYVYI